MRIEAGCIYDHGESVRSFLFLRRKVMTHAICLASMMTACSVYVQLHLRVHIHIVYKVTHKQVPVEFCIVTPVFQSSVVFSWYHAQNTI